MENGKGWEGSPAGKAGIAAPVPAALHRSYLCRETAPIPPAGLRPGLSFQKSTWLWVTQPPEPGSTARLKLPGSSTDSKARLNCPNWITSAAGLGAKLASGLQEEKGGRQGTQSPGASSRENGEGLRLLLSTSGRGGDILCPAGPAEPGRSVLTRALSPRGNKTSWHGDQHVGQGGAQLHGKALASHLHGQRGHPKHPPRATQGDLRAERSKNVCVPAPAAQPWREVHTLEHLDTQATRRRLAKPWLKGKTNSEMFLIPGLKWWLPPGTKAGGSRGMLGQGTEGGTAQLPAALRQVEGTRLGCQHTKKRGKRATSARGWHENQA